MNPVDFRNNPTPFKELKIILRCILKSEEELLIYPVHFS